LCQFSTQATLTFRPASKACETIERPKPRPRNKRVWASVARNSEVVTEEVFEEALRRDPGKLRPWVMLVDGQVQQLKHIKAYIKHHRVEVTLVLDFIHVLEYLWKATYGFHAEGSEEAKAWVAARALQTLKGNASEVAGGCAAARPYASFPLLSASPWIYALTILSNTAPC